jgi:hypothetical protein
MGVCPNLHLAHGSWTSDEQQECRIRVTQARATEDMV